MPTSNSSSKYWVAKCAFVASVLLSLIWTVHSQQQQQQPDDNQAYMKREHSLIKPYHGEFTCASCMTDRPTDRPNDPCTPNRECMQIVNCIYFCNRHRHFAAVLGLYRQHNGIVQLCTAHGRFTVAQGLLVESSRK